MIEYSFMIRDLDIRRLTRKAVMPIAGAFMLLGCTEPSTTLITSNSTKITQRRNEIIISGPNQEEIEQARKIVVVDCRGRDTSTKPNLKVLEIEIPEECMSNLKTKALRNQILSN